MSSLKPIKGLFRTLIHPSPQYSGVRTLAESAAGHSVDFLFIYRTPRKHNYFCQLINHALAEYSSVLVSYHNLPRAPKLSVPTEIMAELLDAADGEIFSARESHWLKYLRPAVLWVRKRQMQTMYSGLSHLLKLLNPKVVVIWNGSKYQDRVLHAANKNIASIAYFENGVLPNSTTLDAKGINANNSVPRDVSFFRQRPLKAYELATIGDRKPIAKKINSDVGITLTQVNDAQAIILMPFQKDRDTQILDNSPWIKNMVQYFDVVSEAIGQSELNSAQVVVREHPSAVTQYPSIYTKARMLPNFIFDNVSKIKDVLAKADVVITINSSVGMEALILGKKVIVLGDAFYNIPGLTLQANDSSTLLAALNAVKRFEVDQELRHKFLEYLANEYVVPGDWKHPTPEHFSAVRLRLAHILTSRNKR